MKISNSKIAYLVCGLLAIIFLVLVYKQKSQKPESFLMNFDSVKTDSLELKNCCGNFNDTFYMSFHSCMDTIAYLKELAINPNTNGGKVIFYYGSTKQVQLSIIPSFNSLKCLDYIVLEYSGSLDAVCAMVGNRDVVDFNKEQKLIVNEIKHDLTTKYGPLLRVANGGAGTAVYTCNGRRIKLKVSDQDVTDLSIPSSEIYTGKYVSIYYYSDNFWKFYDDSVRVAKSDSLKKKHVSDSIRRVNSNPL